MSRQMKAIFFAILLFVGGGVVGALAERYYSMRTVHARPVADTMRKAYVSDMKARLNLTDDQLSRLNVILDQTHSKFRAFRESHRPEFERINQEQISSVRAILTPDQLPKYEKLVQEREERRHQHDQ